MAFLHPDETAMLRLVSQLGHCNPFLPERITLERKLLGQDFCERESAWNLHGEAPTLTLVNPERICARLETVLQALQTRLSHGLTGAESTRQLYEDAVLFLLYYRYEASLYDAMTRPGNGRQHYTFYHAFERDWHYYFPATIFPETRQWSAAHLFACFFQIRRAFHHIFRCLIGGSHAAARLRAAVWQSIFTYDMRRYRHALYAHMRDFTTLILGPSGTGKELVAQAIGLSRYIPFDVAKLSFAEDFRDSFHALNLAALPTTLIESELFGHRRGAFTGAIHDRRGWLDLCSLYGSVFLDEVGDLEPTIQIKLLRVLQARTFQALGETAERRFHGKLIAATNRDLAGALAQGAIREDFYYRLCSDVVTTPTLYEQLQESPEVLRVLLGFLTQRIVGADLESLVDAVERWILTHLGPHYPWPGNIRELEQCVRNVLVRQQYHPLRSTPQAPLEAFGQACRQGILTAEELLRHYCTIVYAQTGSYEAAAQRLQLDRRTVRRKVDSQLLVQLCPHLAPGGTAADAKSRESV